MRILFFLSIAIVMFSCNQVDKENEKAKKKQISEGMMLDSASIRYNNFNIKKDCFDCSPVFLMWFSISDSLSDNLNRIALFTVIDKYPQDTLFIEINSTVDKVNKISATFQNIDILDINGYYELTRTGYRFLSDGNYYYFDKRYGVAYSNKIHKGSKFNIRIYTDKMKSPVSE